MEEVCILTKVEHKSRYLFVTLNPLCNLCTVEYVGNEEHSGCSKGELCTVLEYYYMERPWVWMSRSRVA